MGYWGGDDDHDDWLAEQWRRGALTGAVLALFNDKHPRDAMGRFAAKLADTVLDDVAQHRKPPRAPRKAPARHRRPAKKATPAETPPPPLPVLTGWRPNWWLDVTADTDPDRPVPVRNLEIGTSDMVAVRSGTIHRRGGVVVLVDDDATGDMVSAEKVVREFFAQHREFMATTAQAGEFQRGYAWLAAQNPSDAEWAVRYNLPDFRATASAGHGGVTFMWGRADPVFGPGGDRYTLRHEFGHHVDHGLRDLPDLSHLGSDSPAWAGAARRDSAGYRLSSVVGYTPYGGLRTPELYPDPTRLFPDGVTDYGRSSPAEDFAESVELYLAEGRIGTASLTPGAPRTRVYFRDLFPARAAILDRIFPDVAARQQNLPRTPV